MVNGDQAEKPWC